MAGTTLETKRDQLLEHVRIEMQAYDQGTWEPTVQRIAWCMRLLRRAAQVQERIDRRDSKVATRGGK